MVSTPLEGQQTNTATEAKVGVLRRPATYPDAPGRVDVVETHMSWVFLTDRYAYKMKKPVRYDFLDFSTLALRQRDCEEEVRLNRRFAPDVYLGTVPLTLDAYGNLHLGGEGEVIDASRDGRGTSTGMGEVDRVGSEQSRPRREQAVEWLVKMRRLPAERMLDNMIRQRTVQEADIGKLAMLLARFYQGCSPVELSGEQYRAEFMNALELNRRELSVPEYALPRRLIEQLHAAQRSFISREAGLFDARVEAGKIVEGHGDLRPEHICLAPDPVIIDCLEFNRRFRIVDPVDELAFLAMECERRGAPWIGDRLFHTYTQVTRDLPATRLVLFYKIFRACLRARFAIGHVRELEKKDWPKWQQSAEEYVHLAESYCGQLTEL
jgi:aminoglycoside phosphotransferase family enzyme